MPPGLTPMLEQYHRIKREHSDAILMFRMGDFYEMFFDDAVAASSILDIALTARGRGTDNEAPMCGVPHHAVNSYIARLIESGHRVAVCDQVEEAGAARGLVRREVVRVVSPGTITDPGSLDAREPLFIGALLPDDEGIGAAWIDLSTGDFRLADSAGQRPWDEIALQISTFRPKELILPEGVEVSALLDEELLSGISICRLESWTFAREAAWRAMTEQMGTRSLQGFGCEEMVRGVRAGGALLSHLRVTQRSALSHITRVTPWRRGDYMLLDATTLRTLEVVRSLATGSRAGSLLSVLDRTLTPMGARRLQGWLMAPTLVIHVATARHDAVEELAGDSRARAGLRDRLRGIRDIERLLGRVTLGTAHARDLVALRESLAPLPGIAMLCDGFSAPLLSGKASLLESADTAAPPAGIDQLQDLHATLAAGIADDPPLPLQEGGLIRDMWNSELDELRAITRDGTSAITAIEGRERERTGIPSLKVRYNRVFGYYIEVSRTNLALVPLDYERRQTLVNAERFVTPELKRFEEKVLTARERINILEYEIFSQIRSSVGAQAHRLRAVADRLADLDTLASLAEVAQVSAYVRPCLVDEPAMTILGGRHPVVEALNTEERFVPNDACAGGDVPRIQIVTGPNMGGKSTYLRQVALITLMAQAGSFVPAGSATIGMVDRIFSRLGSADNLAGGQSTFMVEMQETANILNNATGRSLILLDEVGRGTSTFDGLSLAWAIVEHLHDTPGLSGRVFFATHYHELTELALTRPGIRNLTVSVRESGHEVVFLRKIIEGAADRSYGIHVARLAGLPRPVIDRAREVLGNLERNEFGRDGLPRLARHAPAGSSEEARPGQMNLFGPPQDPRGSEIIDELRSLDPDTMTPRQALDALYHIRKRLTDFP